MIVMKSEMSSTKPAQDGNLAEIPDRTCTWCKITMEKRLVGGGQFIHYTCPKCIFQHTSKSNPA